MNKLNGLTLISAIAFVAFAAPAASQAASSGNYSLATAAQKPIPKLEFFELWTEVALNQCAKAQKNNNTTPAVCRSTVEERRPSCQQGLERKTPDFIANTEVTKALGREYLSCVTPYYFCHGVEVKTEAEIRQHCK